MQEKMTAIEYLKTKYPETANAVAADQAGRDAANDSVVR